MRRSDAATLPAPSHSHKSPDLVVISKGIEGGRPPGRILYWEADGFMVLDADAPEDPAELERNALTVVCVDCLLDRYPVLARGMDVACHGGGLARYSEGLWQGERLEP
jgi:hypothetical protein